MRDLAAFFGLAAIGVGCWLISPPAAFIVVGAIVAAAAVWGHLHDDAE